MEKREQSTPHAPHDSSAQSLQSPAETYPIKGASPELCWTPMLYWLAYFSAWFLFYSIALVLAFSWFYQPCPCEATRQQSGILCCGCALPPAIVLMFERLDNCVEWWLDVVLLIAAILIPLRFKRLAIVSAACAALGALLFVHRLLLLSMW